MKEIKVLIRPELLDDVLEPLYAHPEFPGVTISTVRGFGQKVGRDNASSFCEVAMTKLEMIVNNDLVEEVVGLLLERARTGKPGDGKIAVYDVERVARISSGQWLKPKP